MSIPLIFTQMWWWKRRWTWLLAWMVLSGNMRSQMVKIHCHFLQYSNNWRIFEHCSSEYWQEIRALPKFCLLLQSTNCIIMNKYSQDIMTFALSQSQVGLHELYAYLDRKGNTNISYKKQEPLPRYGAPLPYLCSKFIV